MRKQREHFRIKHFLPVILLCSFIFYYGEGSAGSGASSVNVSVKEEKDRQENHKNYSEVAGFILTGRRVWHTVKIEDLDIKVTEKEERFLPLFRLIRAMKLDKKEVSGEISFSPEGVGPVLIDPQHGRLSIDGNSRSVKCFMALSEISLERDLYLLPADISEIFKIGLKWDDASYTFIGKTDKDLSIWKRDKGSSLLAIKTEEITETLPEAHPAALPEHGYFSLDFMEFKGRSKYRAVDPNGAEELEINSLEQTLWGSFMKGRYKVKLSEPSLTFDGGIDVGDGPGLMMHWGEWRYRFNDYEVVAGDSVMGLNHLVFPTLRMSGVRVNGLVGGGKNSGESSGLGFKSYFLQGETFEGYAPVGSLAVIFVNDQEVGSDEVIESLPGMTGTGLYRFEGITLAPGNVNLIRIEITRPDGDVVIVEKNVLGSSTLLPKGAVAFLTGLGTDRETSEWQADGMVFGGRFLYGVSDSLTLGATFAYQDGFYDPVTLSDFDDERQYPHMSTHLGAQIIWQAFDHSIFSLYTAWALGEEERVAGNNISFDDTAFNLEYQFVPEDRFKVGSSLFWYGPEFFNGTSRDLYDRSGFVISPVWQTAPKWNIKGALGKVSNNLDDRYKETLRLDFQSVTVSSSIIPRSLVSMAYDRISPDWGEDIKELVTLEFRTTPWSDLTLALSHSTGDSLKLEENTDFLKGLSLPGISLFKTKSTSFGVKKGLPLGGDVSLEYTKTDTNEKATLSHFHQFSWKIPFEMRTQLGYDLKKETFLFENRTELPLNPSRKSRLSLRVKSDDNEWKVEVSMVINEFISFFRGKPRHLGGRKRIDPDSRVVEGMVFLDRNANTVMDKGEKGVSGIEVMFNGRWSVETDDEGRFIHSLSSNLGKTRVAIKPDSIPAIYSCTHGIQNVESTAGRVTRVHFGLTPLNSVVGSVVSRAPDGVTEPVPGLRLYVKNGQKLVAESITAGDGSYYLGDLWPGSYQVEIDPDTVPSHIAIDDNKKIFSIDPTDEPIEIELPAIWGKLKNS